MNQTEQLAREFSLKLRHYLSEHEMSQVISLNESEEDKDCCHSHDFCDANMVMDEAFIKVFNRSCIFPSDVEENPELAAKEVEDLDLWNAAWTVAKNNKFYQ